MPFTGHAYITNCIVFKFHELAVKFASAFSESSVLDDDPKMKYTLEDVKYILALAPSKVFFLAGYPLVYVLFLHSLLHHFAALPLWSVRHLTVSLTIGD